MAQGLPARKAGLVLTSLAAPQLEGDGRAAVLHRGTHLQIIASAGSGKTEVVAQRFAQLMADGADPAHLNLRTAVGQLFGAVAQSAHAANEDQQQRILDIVNNARREIYTILGEDD